MLRSGGSSARQLDFSDLTTSTFPRPRALKAALKLAELPEKLGGPDKYQVLEHRRRQAQINARRLLELF